MRIRNTAAISVALFSVLMCLAPQSSLAILYGIDVSHYQNERGAINWAAVYNGGKRFVFVKASEGATVADNYLASNIQGATSANLVVGPYHLAHPDQTSATAEAQYFLSRASSYVGNGYLAPTLDLESTYGLSSVALSNWVRTWVQYVASQTNRIPMIYTTRSVAAVLANDLVSPSATYPLWIATYPNNDPGNVPPYNGISFPQWKFNQYFRGEDGGVASGITGPVDLDSFNGTLDDLYALAGGGSPAQMSSPTPGSTFTSSSVTFNWSAGTGVSQYYLYVGNSFGADDIYSANTGQGRTVTVNNIPTDGRTIYVRLWSYIGTSWQSYDYTYHAVSAGSAAQMLSPTPGSTFTSSSVTFSWNTGTGVSQYHLYVSSSFGGNEIYSVNTGQGRVATVNNIPTDGRTIYVRLWSYIGAGWQSYDYTYHAVSAGSAAQMLSPTPGSTFTSSSVIFNWNTGTGVSQYHLYVSSSFGGNEIYSVNTGQGRTATVNNIPTDGRTIYVRLWSYIAGSWQSYDYTYHAVSAGSAAQMLSPTPGSTFTSSSVTFNWNTGTGVNQYHLYVSSSLGGNEIYSVNTGQGRTATVNNIPTDGRTIYVRLWSYIAGSWQSYDYTYHAMSGGSPAQMLSPTPGSTFASSSVTFNWSTGTGVNQYHLYVSSSFGGNEIYSVNTGQGRVATVNNIPTDGRTIYVRLWSYIAGSWQYYDYTYHARP